MAKPILVIRFPQKDIIKIEEFDTVIKHLERKIDDYHILPVIDNHAKQIKFECFNSPHTEMEFEELKHRVLELMKH